MEATTLCLVTLMFFHQVFCTPVVKRGNQRDVLRDPGPLKRFARMTPFWRNIGTKPYGAFCQDSYECSSRICRDGHCSFSDAFQSKK